MLAALLWPVCAMAGAQQWNPGAPIRMVVPYAPGGTADISAREMAKGLDPLLGQNVVVDNRGGGGGVIGMVAIANAAPNGYTIGTIAIGAHASSATLMPNLPYDPVKGFQPISAIGDSPLVLVVGPGNSARSVGDMLATARKNGHTLSFASGGIGLASHIAGELLKYRTKADMTHIPYKGGGPAMVDVMSGNADMLFAPVSSVLPSVKGGKLRAIAIASKQRSALLPDVPTMAEQGFPDFYMSESFCLIGPAGMPANVVSRIQAAAVQVLQQPEVTARFKAQGVDAASSTPKALGQQIDAQIKLYRDVIQKAHIKLD
jgi:tripartite-type tricarboxylate transporter receptor subunit TctC